MAGHVGMLVILGVGVLSAIALPFGEADLVVDEVLVCDGQLRRALGFFNFYDLSFFIH